jgi:hypothetical protein
MDGLLRENTPGELFRKGQQFLRGPVAGPLGLPSAASRLPLSADRPELTADDAESAEEPGESSPQITQIRESGTEPQSAQRTQRATFDL